ncbi:MAG TPA: Rad52/Rad22 family DNA repair protein [Gemmataceae bacterium]|nr:Rad52/Rad22 family DNA repair protein [Gemmataceae bacterium]
MSSVEEVTSALAAPFDQAVVRFKPAVVSGNRALALPYVDARAIQDRLDEVMGVCGWQDEYDIAPDCSVVCKLSLKIGDAWVAKMDVGGPSEQPDGGDRLKAAFSDALKRAAVKFGVGRYLYRLPSQWSDYDPQRRQFVRTPTLPPAAPKPTPKVAPAPKPQPAPNGLPRDGKELANRLGKRDAQLAADGLIQAGELVRHVVGAGVKAGHPQELAAWTGAAIRLAAAEAKAFEARLGQRKDRQKQST